MDKIKSLKLKKLLKELDYVESDFELRNEIVGDADAEFIKSINSLLLEHPELKEIYDAKITEKLNKSIKKSENKESLEDFINEKDEEIDLKERELTNELRKIYREIVKITHPDIVKVKKLNDLYIKATNFYDERNKIGLYQVCNDIGLKCELTEKDTDIIEDNITSFKKKIVFLESTFTWKWYNAEDDSQKNKILLDYVKQRINS
jgi:hypothetical protein